MSMMRMSSPRKKEPRFRRVSIKHSLLALIVAAAIVVSLLALAVPQNYTTRLTSSFGTGFVADTKYAFVQPPGSKVGDVQENLRNVAAKTSEKLRQLQEEERKLEKQLEIFWESQFDNQKGRNISVDRKVNFASSPPNAGNEQISKLLGAEKTFSSSKDLQVPSNISESVIARDTDKLISNTDTSFHKEDMFSKVIIPDGQKGVNADKVDFKMIRGLIDESIEATIPLPAEEIDKIAMEIAKDVPLVLNSPPMKSWRTPCWMPEENLMCLPSVYVLGFRRCAFTDLYYRLTAHKDAVFSYRSEAQFWTRDEAMGLTESMGNYGANVFLKGVFDKSSILVEGNADPLWNFLYMNGTSRPVPRSLLNAQLVKKFTPHAKFIAILRNPTDSAASFFVYLRRPNRTNQKDFHKIMKEIIDKFLSCVKGKGYEACFGDGYLHENLLYWAYVMFIKDWLAVFPREQFFFIKMEEWGDTDKRMDILQDMFEFLGLEKTTERALRLLGSMHSVNDESKIWDNPYLQEISEDSRKMLDELYRPFNEALADMIGDAKFKWKDSGQMEGSEK